VIRLPVHVVRELQQVLRARRTLEGDAEFVAQRPDGVRVEDIAALLGRDVQSVSDLLALSEAPRSLDAGDARGDEGFTLGDTVASDDAQASPTGVTHTHEVERLLDQWVHALDAREREVLEGRYGLHDREPETLEVLSVRLGLTRERIRQIQNEALAKMRRQQVESLDLDAQGVAHKADGMVVFIEGALPFEEVQFNVYRRKNNWEQGTVTAIRRESSQRVRPGCPHFGLHTGACGGCKMQHLHAAAQVAVKQRVLEDNLWHLGKVRPENVLRPLEGPAWGYRYRARLSVRHVARKARCWSASTSARAATWPTCR
jgi:RNA polymerase sigma factor (sigma-70 family)